MKKLTVLVAVVALFAFAVPALAANPFMDVPMNSWAYDAVSQLASQGVISGYPDGTFKGNQPMTRYEMASIVARALAVVDMNKASKQDVEMLKRLVVEFKDELDALGVDVAGLDERVAVLEENLGGWKFWGELRFDSYFADEEGQNGGAYTKYGDTDWKESRWRLWMSKVVDEKVTFIGRVGGSDLAWNRFYAVVQMPYEFEAWIGRWNYDWEDDLGFYIDNDAWFGDQVLDGYYMTRDFSMGNFAFYVAHNEGSESSWVVDQSKLEDGVDSSDVKEVAATADSYRFGAKADFNVSENLRLGLRGLMIDSDAANADENMYEGNFTFNFTPDIAFKGAYMMEDFDTNEKGVDDSPSAFRAILDVSQEAFGFTSLWLEYASADDSFYLYDWDATDGEGPYDNYGASITPGLDRSNYDMETDVLFARLDQSWTDKWGTFQRYVDVSQDKSTPGDYDVTNFTFGVKYQYTPALYFELAYDDIDYGSDLSDGDNYKDDSMVRLRTHLYF
jgi:hypothetical protein